MGTLRGTLAAMAGVALVAGCVTAPSRRPVQTVGVSPISEGSTRQWADPSHSQQMMLDLRSIGLDPGAVVRYGGGPDASPTYAVEYGGPYSMWRIEEFPPPGGVDLAELQYQIEALHRASARRIESELMLRLAERSLQSYDPMACPCGDAGCDWSCAVAQHHRRPRNAPQAHHAEQEVHRLAVEADQRRLEVEAREGTVRDMLRQPNMLIFRWNKPDGSPGGYAVAAGLRRIRLVLGNDFARLAAYGAIDEVGAMHGSTATGVVTSALQARQVIYVEQDDLRDTVTRVLGAMGEGVRRLLTERDVLELELAVSFENERVNSFQHRGYYSRPKRTTLPVHWPEVLAGRMPSQISGGVNQPGSTDSEWVTFITTTTQLATLEEQGRLGPRVPPGGEPAN